MQLLVAMSRTKNLIIELKGTPPGDVGKARALAPDDPADQGCQHVEVSGHCSFWVRWVDVVQSSSNALDSSLTVAHPVSFLGGEILLWQENRNPR